MFQSLYKHLFDIASAAEAALNSRKYDVAFSHCEELTGKISYLHELAGDATFIKIMNEFEESFEILKKARTWLDELLWLNDDRKNANRFSKAVSDIDASKEYAELKAPLGKIQVVLQWFLDNEKAIEDAWSNLLECIEDEQKAALEMLEQELKKKLEIL